MTYKTCATRSLTLIGAALLSVMSSFAITTWSGNYTAVTFASVAGSTHGINSPELGVYAIDGNGVPLTLDQMSWTINSSTYEVDVNFTNSFTGSLYISGPWPASDTSSGFATGVGTNPHKLYNCSGCETAVARKTWNGVEYVSDFFSVLQFPANASGTVNVFVYIRGNSLVYGISISALPSGLSVSHAFIELGVSSMPGGVVPLASAVNTNGVFGSVTDLRTQTDARIGHEPFVIILG